MFTLVLDVQLGGRTRVGVGVHGFGRGMSLADLALHPFAEFRLDGQTNHRTSL